MNFYKIPRFARRKPAKKPGNKVFAVTGSVHGAIVVGSRNAGEARKVFSKAYPREFILATRDISRANLFNL